MKIINRKNEIYFGLCCIMNTHFHFLILFEMKVITVANQPATSQLGDEFFDISYNITNKKKYLARTCPSKLTARTTLGQVVAVGRNISSLDHHHVHSLYTYLPSMRVKGMRPFYDRKKERNVINAFTVPVCQSIIFPDYYKQKNMLIT